MAEKNIKFSYIKKTNTSIKTKIDPIKLQQVIYNLLNNAYKFTPDNGQVILSLNLKNKKIQIRVSDTGSGIPDKYKKHIFEKFQTQKVSQASGLCLGLYICRKIIDLHQGEIWVEDNEFGGASFIIELLK